MRSLSISSADWVLSIQSQSIKRRNKTFQHSLTLAIGIRFGGKVANDAFGGENISSSLIKPITKLISCEVTIIAADCFCVDDGTNGVNSVFNI